MSDRCDALLLGGARATVANTFATTSSRPIIRCPAPSALGLSISHGRTDFAPGLPSIILIGQLGRTVDVVAHEWAHAEIAAQFGFVYRTFVMPTWFDEGLAMQVDGRQAYGSASLNEYRSSPEVDPPRREVLDSSDFFAPGNQGKFHYAYSRCVVARWLETSPGWKLQLQNRSVDFDVLLRRATGDCGPYT